MKNVPDCVKKGTDSFSKMADSFKKHEYGTLINESGKKKAATYGGFIYVVVGFIIP